MDKARDIVIIGCGAGGGTAAQFARKTNRTATVTVFEKDKYPQYSKCGIPYVISGKIPDFKDLIEFSEEWFKKARIDLLLETTVEEIDVKRHVVKAKKSGEVIEKSYDSLILCTGSTSFLPPIENLQVDGVHVVRTINDGKQILKHIKKDGNATVVGAGFVGLEMADSLRKKGMKVNVVEALPNILSNVLDKDMSDLVYNELSKYVTFFTNYLPTKVESEKGNIKSTIIKNKETNETKNIPTDLLIIATGFKAEVSLAKQIGCTTGKTGSIVINENTETSVKNVYAVGDCTEYKDFVTNEPVDIGLGSIAVRQAIAAGINAAGGDYKLPSGVLQTCTSEFFGVEIASVGLPSNFIQNTSVISGRFNGSSLLEYFPGGKPISIKVNVDEKTGRIISAQAVGDNAAQRINTFACAILSGMDVETFRRLETAYAPPIAPTLDAISLACDIASMKLNRKR